jgi:hypothetical protein
MSEVRTDLVGWQLKQSDAGLRINGMTIHREGCYRDARDSPAFEPEILLEAILRDEQERDREGRAPFFKFCRNCMIYRESTWVIR